MCAYPQSDHELPHWKCVLWCCTKYPSVNIPEQETNDQYYNTSSSTIFHIYHLIARCTTHARTPLNDIKLFRTCKHDYVSEQSTKIYTRKELVMMETTISNSHTSFFIPEIQKLEFHFTHVQILGTYQCGDSCQTAFWRQ